MDKKQKFLNALTEFESAYNALNTAWAELPAELMDAVNEAEYPFEHSFDEYDISQWVASVKAMLR